MEARGLLDLYRERPAADGPVEARALLDLCRERPAEFSRAWTTQ